MKPPLPTAARCLGATTAVLLAVSVSAQQPDAVRRVPRIDGDWWQVASNPDLGVLSSDEQEPVDFGVWQAADGTWQLWSCIRKTTEPGKARLFYGWEGPSLTSPNWKPTGIRMQGNPEVGETRGGMQTPPVTVVGDTYHMLYGDWQHICRATSAAAPPRTSTTGPTPPSSRVAAAWSASGGTPNAPSSPLWTATTICS